MNLQPLFETQKILDQRIVEQHGLEGQDLLSEKILALQVELGECANEWRGFKFWSNDQEPRTEVPCKNCDGSAVCHPFIGTENSEFEEICEACQGSGTENPLLEEYVDCLHFILSIGLEINFQDYGLIGNIHQEQKITQAFLQVDESISLVSRTHNKIHYSILAEEFLLLGELLGFSWNQIEQAYYSKNKVNHTRQANGY